MKWRWAVSICGAAAFLTGTAWAGVDAVKQTPGWQQVYVTGRYTGMVPDRPGVTERMRRVALGYHISLKLVPVHTNVPASYNWQYVASLPTPAAAIVADGKPVVYTNDEAAARQVLDTVRRALTPPGLGKTAHVAFAGSVAVRPAVVAAARIVTPAAAVRRILNPAVTSVSGRHAALHWIAARGSAAAPADSRRRVLHADAGVETAAAAGPATAATDVPARPLLTVVARQTVAQTVSVPPPVRYVNDNRLPASVTKVEQAGRPGRAREQVAEEYVNGKRVSARVVQRTVLVAPQPEVIRRGTNTGVASGEWVWPTDSHAVSSPFGWRILDGSSNFHPGIDLACPPNSPVYATNNGVVEDAGPDGGGYGTWIKVSNGDGIETVFGHLSRVTVHAGETVAKGQLIGYSGDTGFSTGPHLHYEVRRWGTPVPPQPYM
ncbi:MAG: peptidoglycan DD-metalloendopeptidase family protein [Alicyclobacillaceae bacterium]|nr:peptidoglycan DD-metalloendopeptidase family protein [Alicyclobacillaceae bacterium]